MLAALATCHSQSVACPPVSLQDAAYTLILEIGLVNISQSSKCKSHYESHGNETLNVFCVQVSGTLLQFI